MPRQPGIFHKRLIVDERSRRFRIAKMCSPWAPCRNASGGSALRGGNAVQFVPSALAPLVTATVHPSSILRAQTDADRGSQMASFVADLQKVAEALRT
jgi:hypothetical protein